MMMQIEIGGKIDQLAAKKTDKQKKQIFEKAISSLKAIEKQYEKHPKHKRQIILFRQVFEQKLRDLELPKTIIEDTPTLTPQPEEKIQPPV